MSVFSEKDAAKDALYSFFRSLDLVIKSVFFKGNKKDISIRWAISEDEIRAQDGGTEKVEYIHIFAFLKDEERNSVALLREPRLIVRKTDGIMKQLRPEGRLGVQDVSRMDGGATLDGPSLLEDVSVLSASALDYFIAADYLRTILSAKQDKGLISCDVELRYGKKVVTFPGTEEQTITLYVVDKDGKPIAGMPACLLDHASLNDTEIAILNETGDIDAEDKKSGESKPDDDAGAVN